MTVESKGRELFIVDNSVSGWTGLRYLEEWSSIAKAFDIATGYFEISALLTLDGKWQGLDKIRILMGAETTHRTRKAILEAVRAQALNRLDESIEEDKEPNPFLHGVPAILEALRSGQIECRVYAKDKFHAKAYITHARLEVVGAQALVGSSNFTRPGLTKNIELNVQVQSAREVAQLQEWFETHWNEAKEVTEDVIETISRHTHLYSPFDVYAKALQQFFRGHDLSATEWDETRSRMFPHLDRYQKEAYWALLKIARQHSGAFLCDGVGLGKTFVGLMLIERLILHEGKRVALFAPKATKEGVWEPHLRRWLPHIGGVGGGADFSNLAVFSHTDLARKGAFPERFRRIAELADVVVIDEAHHFRNPGRQGRPDTGIEPSRYYRLFELLDNAERPKTVFMLTATPINNRLSDFRHMTELFTRRDEAYFARTIGVNNLRAHFNQMENTLRSRVGQNDANAAEHMTEAQEILYTDAFFRQLVVQRSRDYARESQIREFGKAAAFPERRDPQVAAYSIRKTYGRMLDLFERAFAKQSPLFTLPMYYPLHWYRGPDKEIDPFEENRQKQVVGLIRTNFLKRFESSVAAFEISCDRLLRKLLAFLEVHSESDAEKKRLDRWKAQNADVLGYAVERQLELWGEEGKEADDEDVVPQEMLDAVERLDRAEYDVEEMMAETFLDLDQIVQFLDEARKFEPKHDDKLQKLIRLLKSKALAEQEDPDLHRVRRHGPLPQASPARDRYRGRRAGGQCHEQEPFRRNPALRALLQRPLVPGTRREGPRGDPRSDLHRCPLRGSQPPGRLADDQLRHPLEPGPPHAAHWPSGPAHESGNREAARRRPPRGGRHARQGLVLELSPARGAKQDPLALRDGHSEDAPDLQDPRNRGQEAPYSRGRLRGAEGVPPRLRRHADGRGGDAS